MKRNLPAKENFASLAVPVVSRCTFVNFAARFAAPLAVLFWGGQVTRPLSPQLRPYWETIFLSRSAQHPVPYSCGHQMAAQLTTRSFLYMYIPM
jgi:hypothetical protein